MVNRALPRSEHKKSKTKSKEYQELKIQSLTAAPRSMQRIWGPSSSRMAKGQSRNQNRDLLDLL